MLSFTGRHAAALLLLLPLFITSPAGAADVVVYGPGTPSADSAALAETVYKVATEAEESPGGGVAHVLDLPFPSQDPLWMAGDLLQLPCADSTLTEVDPATALEGAIAHVDELDYEKALLKVDQGIRALPCTASEVTRQTLLDLHFFQAMAHFQLGNQPKAKRAFSAALAVNIDMPWKREYPPAPQAVFLDAKSELLTRGTTTLGVDVTGSGAQSFAVDGQDVSTGGPSELIVYRGRHLVRYVDSDGAPHAALVDVSGEGGVVISREALRGAVLNLAWGGVGAAAGKLALSELARNRGADRAVVVVLGDDDAGARAFSFDVSAGTMLPLSVDSDAVAALLSGKGKGTGGGGGASAEGNAAGRVGIVLGGGASFSGTNPYGMVAVRFHLRLVKGLELGFGGQASLAGYDGDTILLPSIAVDVRYRFEGGPFHLYFGGRGVVAFTHGQEELDDTEVYAIGGGGGVIGFDITPAGDKGFVINVDIAGGATGRGGADGAQLWLTLGAGVGYRF